MKAGIWIDLKKAFIIGYDEEPEKQTFIKIESDVEDFRPKGGSGSSIPYAEQEAVSEKKYLERKKHQMKDYFETLKKEINKNNIDNLIIFGPAETKIELRKELQDSPGFRDLVSDVHTADNMTENQLKEWVRNHFK